MWRATPAVHREHPFWEFWEFYSCLWRSEGSCRDPNVPDVVLLLSCYSMCVAASTSMCQGRGHLTDLETSMLTGQCTPEASVAMHTHAKTTPRPKDSCSGVRGRENQTFRAGRGGGLVKKKDVTERKTESKKTREIWRGSLARDAVATCFPFSCFILFLISSPLVWHALIEFPVNLFAPLWSWKGFALVSFMPVCMEAWLPRRIKGKRLQSYCCVSN